MAETIGIEALAAAGGFMPALITLIGGGAYWLVRDSERNLRREVASVEQNLRREMERNHREMLDLLRGHTHGQDNAALCSVSTRNRGTDPEIRSSDRKTNGTGGPPVPFLFLPDWSTDDSGSWDRVQTLAVSQKIGAGV